MQSTDLLQSSLQFSSVTQSCLTLCNPMDAAHQASLSITNSRMLCKLMSIESVMPSSHLILCRPLLLPPSIFPSIRVFSNKLLLRIRWPKYWSFRFSLSPSNEYSGLIAFRIDQLDLLAVFTISSYTLPSGGAVRNSRGTAGLHGSVCQTGQQSVATFTVLL